MIDGLSLFLAILSISSINTIPFSVLSTSKSAACKSLLNILSTSSPTYPASVKTVASTIAIGTFKNSINPNTVKFREFPEWVEKQNFSDEEKQNKKIAMFCTGGIRCEKASSMMIKDGFKKVKHLQGGILNYFEKINEEESLWEGECFVFDDRVAIKHDLSEGSYDMCHGCRMPITDKDKSSELYIRGVACPSCYNQTSDEQKSRYMSRQKQVDLAKKRNQKHIGPKDEVQIKTK